MVQDQNMNHNQSNEFEFQEFDLIEEWINKKKKKKKEKKKKKRKSVKEIFAMAKSVFSYLFVMRQDIIVFFMPIHAIIELLYQDIFTITLKKKKSLNSVQHCQQAIRIISIVYKF